MSAFSLSPSKSSSLRASLSVACIFLFLALPKLAAEQAQTANNGNVQLADQLLALRKEMGGLETVQEARYLKLVETLKKAKDFERHLSEIEPNLDKAQKELRALLSFKSRALDDLRGGQWCTQCEESRTQIESDGRTSFAAHVAEQAGKFAGYSAPQSVVNGTIAHYDGQISPIRRTVDKLDGDRRRYEWLRQTEGSDTEKDDAAWGVAVRNQIALLERMWALYKNDNLTRRNGLVAKLDRVTQTMTRATKKQKPDLQARQKLVQSQIDDLARTRKAIRDEILTELDEFVRFTGKQQKSLFDLAGALSNKYLIAGSTIQSNFQAVFFYQLP